jgi:hypothetical protein
MRVILAWLIVLAVDLIKLSLGKPCLRAEHSLTALVRYIAWSAALKLLLHSFSGAGCLAAQTKQPQGYVRCIR